MFQYPPQTPYQQAPRPPAYMAYDYISPTPLSPRPVTRNGVSYSPRYSLHTATPSPRASPRAHARRKSAQESPAYSYTTPRRASQYATAEYQASPSASSPRYFYTQYRSPSPSRRADFVSEGRYERVAGCGWRRRTGGCDGAAAAAAASTAHSRGGDVGSKRYTSRSHSSYKVFVGDDADLDDAVRHTPPPPYEHVESCRPADYHSFYEKVPVYTEAEPASTARRSRARRSSNSGHGDTIPPPPLMKGATFATGTPRGRRPSISHRQARHNPATEEDARRAGVPTGYSYKNWDPNEEPILLLGSVFDANSLGKWIYDWTVYRYGAASPMSEVSGELWLLLIQLAGKVRRAEEGVSKVRRRDDRELVEDYLERGERLWSRFEKLLNICEDYMWRVAKKQSSEQGGGKRRATANTGVVMGKSSGFEFVDTLFGRDRELERTEKLMTGMRLWGMRFDSKCEEILKKTST